MASTRQIIAKQVREAREKRKLTQVEVAKGADISVTYYAMIERGDEKADASSDILGRIAKVLKIKIQI